MKKKTTTKKSKISAAEREQNRDAQRAWRKNNPDKVRAAQDRQNESRRLKREAAKQASEARRVSMSPTLGASYGAIHADGGVY